VNSRYNNSIHTLACVTTGHLHTAAMPWKVCCKQEPKILEFMTDPWVLFFTGKSLCLPLWILHKLVKICYCNIMKMYFQEHKNILKLCSKTHPCIEVQCSDFCSCCGHAISARSVSADYTVTPELQLCLIPPANTSCIPTKCTYVNVNLINIHI
jgi:hypothetical protein